MLPRCSGSRIIIESDRKSDNCTVGRVSSLSWWLSSVPWGISSAQLIFDFLVKNLDDYSSSPSQLDKLRLPSANVQVAMSTLLAVFNIFPDVVKTQMFSETGPSNCGEIFVVHPSSTAQHDSMCGNLIPVNCECETRAQILQVLQDGVGNGWVPNFRPSKSLSWHSKQT